LFNVHVLKSELQWLIELTTVDIYELCCKILIIKICWE